MEAIHLGERRVAKPKEEASATRKRGDGRRQLLIYGRGDPRMAQETQTKQVKAVCARANG